MNLKDLKDKLRKKEEKTETQQLSADEALFDSLEKEKKRKKKKRIIIVVVIVAVILLTLLIGTIVLQNKVRTQFASSSEEVLSAQVEKGTISTLVSGSGQLVNVDTETVSVPSGVEVTEILVEYGDTVNKGDMLATVDMASVRTTMSALQESIESLDSEIASAEGDTVNSYISSVVSGRVKAIYATKGELVEDVMGEYGSLAILSLDGYMSTQITSDKLAKGDEVVVVREDGTEKKGKVETVIGNRVTVLVADDGPEIDEQITVKTTDGEELGTGILAVHNPMAVTGYAGTISTVNISLNQKVYAYSTLFTLSNTSTTASYNALLRTRSEYEETLLQLLDIQRNSALVAPISGSIYSVADLDEDTDEEILDIVTISPDKQMEVSITVDESDILSLELGQKADVTVSSVSDDTLEGVVTEIDKTYTSGSYTAVVTIDKAQGMIPGMTASVDIRIEGVDDALLIPAEALHQTSSGYYVYTSYDEQTQQYGGMVDVIPGLSNSNYVEIKSGLNEGDTVYYTEKEEFFNPFGNGGMPSGFGGGSGSSGSGMPSGGPSGGMPSGGPSGGMPSGGKPSNFGG